MPLDFPTVTGLTDIQWSPTAIVALHQSPVTGGGQQVYRWPGQFLSFSAKMPPMTKSQAQVWQSFFLRCNGPENTFYFRDTTPGQEILGNATAGGLIENNLQTFTAATSNICTATAHGYSEGDRVQVTTDDTLPLGLAADTDYYIRSINADTFYLSEQLGTGQSFVSVAATDLITSAAHNRRNGDIIYLFATTIATGLTENTAYYIITRTTDTFQLATTRGGVAVDITADDGVAMTWSTTPIVDITDTGTGAHTVGIRQIGEEINTRGWLPDTIDLFKAGDWISVNDRLRRVIIDADSDANGDATLTVWPRINEAFDDGDEIKVGSDARGIFRMSAIPAWTRDVSRLVVDQQFSGFEAL
tara:strand:+ start:1929 stop:3005 length:1077 start_codon:yes stop_codon:yes gene_type:complete